MRNYIKAIIIGIFTMILLSGGASATCTADANTVCLTNTNNNELTGIVVKVDISNKDLNVQLDNNPVSNNALGIDKFYYNSNTQVSGVFIGTTDVTTNWVSNGQATQADGFGPFPSGRYQNSAGTDGINSPITFRFGVNPSFDPPKPEMAVHIRFDTCSGWVSNRVHSGTDNTDTTFGCTSNKIPEFPTVALPIAAVIGLIFIMQRLKKEE